MEQERQVLVIFPHPDDEAFGVSGTMAKYVKMGVPVTYACLTLGQMGRNLGNPPFTTREGLPSIREKELKKAVEAIGVRDLRMMGFRDKTLEFETDEKMDSMVKELIDELNPSLIITFYPDYSVHPDHEATARSVVRTVRTMPETERPKLYCVAFSHDHVDALGQPDVIHSIEEVAEQKKNALRAHISQTVWLLEEWEPQWKAKNPEAMERLIYERFYTYQWENDRVK